MKYKLASMRIADTTRFPIAAISAFVVLVALLTRIVYFYFSPDQTLISTIPDDTFYYIQMARHRAFDGIWSFDGTRPSTGFHFLYAHLLVVVFKLFGNLDWRTLYALICTLACVFIAGAAYLNVKSCINLFDHTPPWVAAVPFLSPMALLQGNAMMESWLVLFFSAASIHLLSRPCGHPTRQMALLFATGLLGSLSRSDFGMLAGAATAAWLLLGKKDSPQKTGEHLSLLLGASAGVGVIFAHNYMIGQQLQQASAQTKYYWSSLSGHSVGPALKLALGALLPYYEALPKLGRAIARIAIPLLLIAALVRTTRGVSSPSPSRLTVSLAAASGLTLVGYVTFYRYNSEALQNWYCANLLAPAGIVLGAIMNNAASKASKALLTIVWLSSIAYGMANILFVPYPHAAGMMEAGLLIRHRPPTETYGAWNWGIISYFSGRRVINIDGLANDEVLPFIKDNALITYLKAQKIDAIIDYQGMLDNKTLQRRGGYVATPGGPCLIPVEMFSTTPHNTGEYQMERIEIAQHCPSI